MAVHHLPVILSVLKVVVPFYWVTFSIAAPTVDKVFLTRQQYNWVKDFVKNVLFQLTGGCLTTTLFIINAALGRLLFGATEYTDASVSLIKYQMAPFGKQLRQKFDDPRFETDECDWCKNPLRLLILSPFFAFWVISQISLFCLQLALAFVSIFSLILFPFGTLHADMASQMTGKYFVEKDFPSYVDQILPVHAQPTVDLSSAAMDKFLMSEDSDFVVSRSKTNLGEKNDGIEAPPRPTFALIEEENSESRANNVNLPPPDASASAPAVGEEGSVQP
eukprot:TRINITY_DN7400_c0_g1_i7.p1 TRINITY_DN7400_c0_g1~~TRINITY_DN7400_c0_g1_i7.p1  ORF type:complete len:277 (-),score=63.83 TRINITY_DN7400_c0_g1_i7:29-859(-)